MAQHGGPRPNSGGKRPGAGRPKGAGTVRTRRVAMELAQRDETPLHIMVAGMLELWHAAQAETDQPRRLQLVKEAIAAAVQAAPYMHARITSVSATVRTIGSLKDLTDEELVTLAASVGAAASSPDAERVH